MKKNKKAILVSILSILIILTHGAAALGATVKSAKVYKAGKYYLAGVDIPVGEYYAAAKKGAAMFYKLDEPGDLEASSTMTREFEGSHFFLIEEGEYIYFTNCDVYPLLKTPKPKLNKDKTYPSGMYKVGLNLPVGRYIIIPLGGDPAYGEIWGKPTYRDSELLAKGHIYEEDWFSFKKGEYFYIRNAKLKQIASFKSDFGMSLDQFTEKFKKADSNSKRYPFKLKSQSATKTVYSVYENFDIEITHTNKGARVKGVRIKSYFPSFSTEMINDAFDNLEHYSSVFTKVLYPKMSYDAYEAMMDDLDYELSYQVRQYRGGSEKHLFAYVERDGAIVRMGLDESSGPFIYFEMVTMDVIE